MMHLTKRKIACCSEEDVIQELYKRVFDSARFSIHNYYLKNFQMDFLEVTGFGYLHEYEIKTNYADLIKDFRKDHKHEMILTGELTNRFLYVLPSFYLIDFSIIPDKYGILTFDEEFNFEVIRKGKLLHQRKISEDMEKDILHKSYRRYKRLLVKTEK